MANATTGEELGGRGTTVQKLDAAGVPFSKAANTWGGGVGGWEGCVFIRQEMTTASEQQRPSPSTPGPSPSTRGSAPLKRAHISSCSIQRAGFHTAPRRKQRGGKRAAATHCLVEKNDFANSGAEKRTMIVGLCLNEERWDTHIGGFILLRKNTGGRGKTSASVQLLCHFIRTKERT